MPISSGAIISPGHEHLATTQWTMVLQAAREDVAESRPALAELFLRYRQPLYSVARHRGLSPEDAADAVQEFFGELIAGQLLQTADQAKGSFRAFLMTAWRRFLIDQYRRENATKRGGQTQVISIQAAECESSWTALNHQPEDPDQLFQRQWAESLIDNARQQLVASYAQRDRAKLIETLLPVLTSTVDRDMAERLAHQLAMSTTAVKVALHRARVRFGQILRQNVAETVEDACEVDAELDTLLKVFSGQ